MQLLFWKQSDGISVDLVHSGCGSPGSRGSNDQLGGRAAVRMAHTSPGRGRSADRNPQLSASHCSVLYCHSCRSFFILPFLRYAFASFFFPFIIQQILQNIFKVIKKSPLQFRKFVFKMKDTHISGSYKAISIRIFHSRFKCFE